MSTYENYIDKLLTGFIEELKNTPPLRLDEYNNLFVEMGNDVVTGDGEICNHVFYMLKMELVAPLPIVLRQWIWWQTASGRVEEKYIHEAFQSTPPNFEALENCAEDILHNLTKTFNERLRQFAEMAYSRHWNEDYEPDDAEDYDWWPAEQES